MCCQSPNWPAKANHAKCLGIAVLVFGIIDCVSFVGGGWLAGIAALLGIISASLIICCGPPTTGPGSGCKFKAAAILAGLAAILHVVGAILMVLIIIAVDSGVGNACLDGYCADNRWSSAQCCTGFGLSCPYSSTNEYVCGSENECRTTDPQVAACDIGSTVVSGFVQIILWPIIILTIVQAILELSFAINSMQAVKEMEAPAGEPQMAVAQPVTQPVTVAVATPIGKS